MVKTLRKLEIEGNLLNSIKNIHPKPTANKIFKAEKLKAFLLRSGKDVPLLFNMVLELLAK